jgi:DNA-binding NarL/FixJ family response regulator
LNSNSHASGRIILGGLMKIQINLGSFLLGKAFQELLTRDSEAFQVLATTDNQDPEDFRPDFIVMDVHTLKRMIPVSQPRSKIILIDYGLGEEEIASLLLSYKVDGVIATTTDLALFKKALNAISAGQIWIDNSKIKALMLHVECTKDLSLDECLSKKEREIIIYIKTHISSIFRKLKVSRRSQLVPMAMKLRIANSA